MNTEAKRPASAKENKHSILKIKMGGVSIRYEGHHSFIEGGGLMKTLGEAVALSKSLPESSARSDGGQISKKAEPSSPQHKPSFKSFLATRGIKKVVDVFTGAAFFLCYYDNKESFTQNELRQLMKKGGEPYLKSRNTIEKSTRTYINRLIKQGKFLEDGDGNISMTDDLYQEMLVKFGEG